MNVRAKINQALDAQWARRALPLVVVDLPFPPSVNRLLRRGRTGMIPSPRYETWKQAAGNALNAQKPGRVHGEYSLTLLVQNKANRPDLDNCVKAVSDCLQTHRVISNDKLARRIVLEWSDDIEGTRAIIEAYEPYQRRAA